MAKGVSIPNPFDSDQEFSRYHHFDLGGMETAALLCELTGNRYRLWVLQKSEGIIGIYERKQRIEWYEERICRVESELRKRRYTTWEVRSQPKSKLAEGVRL
jgi:hypothetical protein